MRFCALTVDQHRNLYKLIYKTIVDSKSFDLKGFTFDVYNKVFNKTKNQELALTYASYVPMYASNLSTEDKEVRTIMKESKSDANVLLDKIDDFDNNLQNVLEFIGVQKETPVIVAQVIEPTPAVKEVSPQQFEFNQKNKATSLRETYEKDKQAIQNTPEVESLEFINSVGEAVSTKKSTKEEKLKKLEDDFVAKLAAIETAKQPAKTQAKPLTKVKQGDKVVANGELVTVQSVIISQVDGKPNTYILEDQDGNKLKQSFTLEELSAPAIPAKPKSKEELLTETRNLVVEGTQRAETREEIEEIMKNVFNLNPIQASAVASIYDRVATTFARRFNKTVKDFYDTLGFRQSKMEDLTPDAKFQIIGETGVINGMFQHPEILNSLVDAKMMEKKEKLPKNYWTTVKSMAAAETEEEKKVYRSVRKIYIFTGWERGADGQWRYDTQDKNDFNLKEIKTKAANSDSNLVPLKSIIKDPELFNFYPNLGAVLVHFDSSKEAGTGSFNGGGLIKLGTGIGVDLQDLNKLDFELFLIPTLRHEIQHFVQDEEGFAQGGNLNSYFDDNFREYFDELSTKFYSLYESATNSNNKKLKSQLNNIAAKLNQLRQYKKNKDFKNQSYEYYRSLAGEVEAANADFRSSLDKIERVNLPLVDTEAVPRSEQIIKFQQNKGVARAAVTIAEDGQAIVHAITNPNVTSPLHELAHIWEHYLDDKERKTILDWSETKEWSTETSEKFARGFEKYLAEGDANDVNLQMIFDRFAKWLKDIYKGIFGSEIDVQLNDQMRKIYSDMLGSNFQQKTQEELNAELDTRNVVERLLDKHAEDLAKGRDFTEPVPAGSNMFWSHVSVIQQAFINKKYDKLLKEGKINEEALKQIVISTIDPIEGGLGMDLVTQAVFRVNHPELIADANYWVTLPEKDSDEYSDYQRVVQEIATDGRMIDALNNKIISYVDAGAILKRAEYKIAVAVEKRIAELKEEAKKNGENIEEIQAKATFERAKSAIITPAKPKEANPPIIKSEGIEAFVGDGGAKLQKSVDAINAITDYQAEKHQTDNFYNEDDSIPFVLDTLSKLVGFRPDNLVRTKKLFRVIANGKEYTSPGRAVQHGNDGIMVWDVSGEDFAKLIESFVKAKEDASPTEQTLIEIARKNASAVKIGIYKSTLETGTDEDVNAILKEVSDQWHDEDSRAPTETNFGKEIVDVAIKLYPQESYSTLAKQSIIETVNENEIGNQIRKYNPKILEDVVNLAYDGLIAQEITDALNAKYDLKINREEVKQLRDYLGIPKSNVSVGAGFVGGGAVLGEKTSEEQKSEFQAWKDKINKIKNPEVTTTTSIVEAVVAPVIVKIEETYSEMQSRIGKTFRWSKLKEYSDQELEIKIGLLNQQLSKLQDILDTGKALKEKQQEEFDSIKEDVAAIDAEMLLRHPAPKELVNFKADDFKLSLLLKVKRIAATFTTELGKELYRASKAKDIAAFDIAMEKVARIANNPNKFNDIVKELHLFVVEEAQKMFPNAELTDEDLLDLIRQTESELSDVEVDAMPNKSKDSKDFIQGDMVELGEERFIIDEIIYGETAEENMYLLDDGSVAYQDQITKVFPDQDNYDLKLREYNSVAPQIFRDVTDEFENKNLNAEQLVEEIKLKREVNEEKVPLRKGEVKKAADEIVIIIEKAKKASLNPIQTLNNIKKAGYVFYVKESDSILNYLKDYLGNNTEVKFDEYMLNTNYQNEQEEQGKDDTFNYLGLKTILERLNAKFNNKIPYEIVKNNESWTARIKNGIVQINLNKFDKTTPFHEYLHPFIKVLQIDNRALYDNLMFELKGLKEGFALIDDVARLPFYKGMTQDEIEEEALIRYIASKAAENVDNKGRRIESKYKSKMERLIDRFRDWFNRLWHGGKMILGSNLENKMSDKNNEISSFRTMPLDTTLEDIADLISLHDLTIDLSERMNVVTALEKYQDEKNEEAETYERKILNRIKSKLSVLEHTARTRQANDVLLKDLIGLRTILKDPDEVTSVFRYFQQGVGSLEFANQKFKAIAHKLHAAAGKLTPEEIQMMSSDIQVIKTFIALYNDVESILSNTLEKDLDDATYRAYDETFKKAASVKRQMEHVSIDLLTEFLYPEVEIVNAQIDPKHAVTKEKFKESLYGREGDIDVVSFLLGSVSSSKDILSAVVRAALSRVQEENHFYEATILEDIKIKYDQFLKKVGLKNEAVPTEDYYKNNFLRKVTLTLQKGIDANKEPIMVDSEHWAFIQEFDSDLWDQDRTKFMESIDYENVAEGNDLKAKNDVFVKLRDWENANSQKRQKIEHGFDDIMDGDKIIGKTPKTFTIDVLVPSNKYKNARWDTIKDDPLYQSLMQHYNEANDKLGDKKLSYGVVPQVSKGKALFADFRDKSASERLKIAVGKVKDFVLPNADEETDSITGQNLDGTTYYGVQNKHNMILEEGDLNLTLPETVLKFASDNNLATLKKSIDPTIQILKDSINGNEMMTIGERKIFRQTGKGKLIWDKWRKRPAALEKQSSLLNKQLTEFINDVMYGEDQFEAHLNVKSPTIGKDGKLEIVDKSISLNTLGNNLGFLTALNNMAFNINGAIGNSTIGNAQLFIEASGGRYFNKSDWFKAEAQYVTNIGTFINDSFDLKKSLITQLGIKYDAIQGEFRDKFGKQFVGNIASRYANGDTLFILNHIAEHQIQLTGMLSLMNATKVKTNTGETISLYDAHYVNKDGFLRVRDDVQWTKQDEINFTNRWHGINKRLNGNYSAFDKSLLQRRWYGKLTLLYRKFIYTSFRSRFTGEYTDYELQARDFGYQRKFFGKLASDIKEYKWDAAQRFFSKKGWSRDEKIAYTKTMTEFGMLAAMSVVVYAIAKSEAGDDDSTWAEKQMLLYATRFRNDLQLFTVLGVSDIARILQNPSAIMNTVTKYVDFFAQLGSDIGNGGFEQYNRKTGYFEKGDYKLKAKLFKAMPIVRQFINFLSPEDQLAYYNVLSKK